MFVPMRLPSILLPLPVKVTPLKSLPEMRLRSAGEVPPMVELPPMSTPVWLPSSTVPEGSVPMKLPSTLQLAPLEARMPSELKPLITSPLITLFEAKWRHSISAHSRTARGLRSAR